jgi:hypothetical protein
MSAKLIAASIFAIITVAIIICVLCFYPPFAQSDKKTTGMISAIAPKIMWTYWNKNDLPPIVSKCVASWKRHHPDYEIIVLTPSNLHTYSDINPKAVTWNTSPARESDIVRLHILAKYGGVWSDASILLLSPLPFLNKLEQVDFMGFYLDGFTTDARYPVIESWWFATKPGGEFITKWRDAFMGKDDHDIPTRLKQMKGQGVDVQKIDDLNYLFIHVAAQYVLQKQLSQTDIAKNMLLMKAEDGPYKYLTDNKWNPGTAVQALVNNTYASGMVKLRGPERGHLVKHTKWIDSL